jgi:uncharacterized CHY-type Zn-finger protein
MKCEFRNHEASNLIHLRVFSSKGIRVCPECYEEINSHRHKPYSRVMDRLAEIEVGYHVNRKMARLSAK